MSNEKYVFDLDKIMEFVFDGDNERTSDTEITESYAKDEETKELSLSNRIIHEVKGSDNSAKNTIKYDLIKMFIDNLLNIEVDSDVELPTTFGEETILNTMSVYGMIKKVKKSEEE